MQVSADSMASFGVPSGAGGKFIGTSLTEAKTLVGAWGKGTFSTLSETIAYHFEKHGGEVGAENVLHYLRKAFEFNRNLKGAAKKLLEDACDSLREKRSLYHQRRGRQHFVVRIDRMSRIDDLLKELDALNESNLGPFPYEGCRRLKAALREGHDALIPDLDAYLSEFAGYRSWGKRILQWPDEKIETIAKRLNQTFFDRFPAYAAVEPILVSSEAADVNKALHHADRTRAVLGELLPAIRTARRAGSR
jgi:hypothetical protein